MSFDPHLGEMPGTPHSGNAPKKEPRVLIACPTLGINPDPHKWLASLIKILNQVRKAGFTHATFFPYKQLWWEANNEIWDCAFVHKFDYILRMDDDVWNVSDDAFEKLLAANVDVIGAAYCNRFFPYKVNAMVRTTEDDLITTNKECKQTLKSVVEYGHEGIEIIPCDLVGFGLTLIKVAAFKYLPRPLYQGEEVCPDDSYFAQICLDNKIQQYVHMGVRLQHQHVTMENAGHLFNADVLQFTRTPNGQTVASDIQL